VRKLPAPASSLSWHPSTNALLCGTTAGSYGIWPSPVPTGGDSNLPSPYKLIDELDREADRAAAAAAAAAAAVNEQGEGCWPGGDMCVGAAVATAAATAVAVAVKEGAWGLMGGVCS